MKKMLSALLLSVVMLVGCGSEKEAPLPEPKLAHEMAPKKLSLHLQTLPEASLQPACLSPLPTTSALLEAVEELNKVGDELKTGLVKWVGDKGVV